MCSINKFYCLNRNKSAFSVTFMDTPERVCPNFILDHSLAARTFNVLGFFFFFLREILWKHNCGVSLNILTNKRTCPHIPVSNTLSSVILHQVGGSA